MDDGRFKIRKIVGNNFKNIELKYFYFFFSICNFLKIINQQNT